MKENSANLSISLPHHVLVLNPDGHLLQVNQMVLDYTGRTLEEMQRYGDSRTDSQRYPSRRH